MSQFPLVAGSYLARAERSSTAQRTVNLYPEASGSGNSKSIAMLIGTPGTVDWNGGIGGLGPVRGIAAHSARRWPSRSFTTASCSMTPRQPRPLRDRDPRIWPGEHGEQRHGRDARQWRRGVRRSTRSHSPSRRSSTRTSTAQTSSISSTATSSSTRPARSSTRSRISTARRSTRSTFASAEGAPDLLISLIVDHKEIWLLRRDDDRGALQLRETSTSPSSRSRAPSSSRDARRNSAPRSSTRKTAAARSSG
jgi:hypothetical protein